MEPIKISLADAAIARGCSVDYLLALAEAERIDIFARVEPFTARLTNMRGEPMPVVDKQGVRVPVFGLRTVPVMSYTVLLTQEAAMLRGGAQVTIRLMREEGTENGTAFPSLSDENYFWQLTKPQTIGIEQLCMNGNEAAEAVSAVSALPPAALPVSHPYPQTVTTTTHRIKTKTQPLAAEIKQAKTNALDKDDPNSVWAELLKMAEKQIGCLLGVDGDEIRYRMGEEVKFFKKRSLSERMGRATTH